METRKETRILEARHLRECVRVFHDRCHAGEVLAQMLEGYSASDALVLAIPLGGVPVAAVVAERLQIALDVAVVSKITPSWNTEVGYGAVAFDGTVRLNERVMRDLGVTEQEAQEGIAQARAKVKQRLKTLRGDKPLPAPANKKVILVDDGLASGWTMMVAVEALHKSGPAEVIVAVPTAHGEAVQGLVGKADAVFCANVRTGRHFAVADAYVRWSDVDEKAAAEILSRFRQADKVCGDCATTEAESNGTSR